MIRVGPAGWSYPDWDGRVYPQRRPHGFHGLRFLAQYFDCIEINASFYANPRPEHAAQWVQCVAEYPNFRFIAKLQRGFTHEPWPASATVWEELAAEFLAGIAPLERSKKLAAILVQFPLSFVHSAESIQRLGRLRALLGQRPLVVELRHHSWFEPPALASVRGLSYSLAWIDLPHAWNHPPAWHEPTASLGYLRLHGRNSESWFRRDATRDQRYDYLYSPGELAEVLTKARRIAAKTAETYVITNNHFAGKAVANGLQLLSALRGSSVNAPLELIAAYPELRHCTRAQGQTELFESS